MRVGWRGIGCRTRAHLFIRPNWKMSMNEETNPTRVLSATTLVFNLVARIGGLIVGLTAIGYLVGSIQVFAYYSELGAPWAAELLNPAQTARWSLPLIGPLFAGAFMSVYSLVDGTITHKGLRRWSQWTLISSVGLYIIAVLLDSHYSSSVRHTLVLVSVLIMAFCIGLTIGELIAVLALNELKWHGYGLHLVLLILIFGLSWAPLKWGESMGRLHIARAAGFPEVSLLDVSDKYAWRLVGPVGSNFLLIAPHQSGEHFFRLVSHDSMQTIASKGEMRLTSGVDTSK